MENEEQQQFEAFIAKLSRAELRARHRHILAFVKEQKKVARNARRVFSRSLPFVQVDVNTEFGHHFILLETLFEYPEEAWGDPVAMREHRKNPVWQLTWKRLEPLFRCWKLSVARGRKLTDFYFPAFWLQLAGVSEKKEKVEAHRRWKEENANLRSLAALEKLAQQSGNAESLRLVERQWPREVKAVWAGHCLYGERLRPVPLSYLRRATKRKKGRPQRLLVRSLRSASLKGLTEWNFTKSKASFIVDKIETILGVSKPLYVGRDGYGKPYRVDAVLKSQ